MPILFLLLVLLPLSAAGREPPLEDVQQEAVRYLGFDSVVFDRWNSRAGWAAAFPRLQVGFSQDLKDQIRFTESDTVSVSGGEVTVGPDETDFDQGFDRGLSLDLKAVWYLDELVFNRDRLAISSEQRAWVRERARVLEEVTEAWLARARSERVQGRGDRSSAELGEAATARIDALTGGWFSRELAR